MKTIKSNHGLTVSISVIIPVYKGKIWIERCLDSLRKQSLPDGTFEIILVFNGPDDGGINVAQKYQLSHEKLEIRILVSSANNAAKARNVGLGIARGTHVTWVDIDDLVSSNYLLSLGLAAAPDIIPMAQLANIDEYGRVTRNTVINNDLLSQEKSVVAPTKFTRATTFMTAKLIPTEWVARYPLEENLRSGEDVAFYGKLIAKYNFQLSIMPGLTGATYFRQMVPLSVSRGRSDREFMVNERALVIKSLDESIKLCETNNSSILQGYINSQQTFIKRYISNNPTEMQSVMDYLSGLDIENISWIRFYDSVEDLAICYNFAPYSDTGANVAAKRIRDAGFITDVISNDMSSVREQNTDNYRLSKPYVGRLDQLKAPVTFANGPAILAFVEQGLRQYRSNVRSGRKYKRIYSRSMWPASHFLAAAIRQLEPTLEWTAEFSDPVRITTEGTIRQSPLPGTSAAQLIFGDHLSSLPKEFIENEDVYSWAELLPYYYADKIVFTNENQLELMTDSAPDTLASRIREVSLVSHHPTLPSTFYELGVPKSYGQRNKTRVGYFGEFYSTRGLQEILDSLLNLEQVEQDKLELHVHSSTEVPEKYNALLDRVIFNHGKLSYYDFLSSLNEFDCVIVNDAVTRDHHRVNPYLPSKYSDYRGSMAPIWAVVEPGSVLSTRPAEYQSVLGDTDGALRILRSLLSRQR